MNLVDKSAIFVKKLILKRLNDNLQGTPQPLDDEIVHSSFYPLISCILAQREHVALLVYLSTIYKAKI